MALFYRRIILVVFVIIFLILAPTLILYSEGYRYNFQKARVQKTGILIISSIPKKADIWLNGQKVAKVQTPARIQYLLPADYEIKLTKDGYHDWTKKLPIYENFSTFAEKIVLWKKSLPEIIADEGAVSWLASVNNQSVAIVTEKNSLEIISTANNAISPQKLPKSYDSLKLISWSDDEKKLIVAGINNNKADYYLFSEELFGQTLTNLDSLLPPSITSISFDENNNNLIYSANPQGIWKTNLTQKNKQLTAPGESPESFLTLNNQLYLFDGQAIYRRDLNNSNVQKITDVNCNDCHFIEGNINKLILWNSNSQEILFIDPDNKSPIIREQAKGLDLLNTKLLSFSGPQNDSLLFYNDWEIWIWSSTKQEPELITRFGEKIDAAVWQPSGRHIIFGNGNKIRIIELDNRELRNIVDLAITNNLKNLATNPNGDYLYYNASSSTEATSTKSLFRLELQ